MAKLVYCKVCKATYPLNVIQGDAGRSGKVRELLCPMGHAAIEEVDTPGKPRGAK